MSDIDPKAHQFLARLAQQAGYVHDFAKGGQQTEALEHAGAVERLLTAWRLAAGHADREAIHLHFSLSYANYLVLPRTLLQSMPDVWQAQFVALLEQMDNAFAHVPQAEGYKVEAATMHEVSDLDEGQRAQLGITEDWYRGETPPEGLSEVDLNEWRAVHEDPEGPVYWQDGSEIDGSESVMLPVADPVPHYRHARLEPKPTQTEELAAQ